VATFDLGVCSAVGGHGYDTLPPAGDGER